MANTTLQLRKSGQTGNVPPSLSYGELALNYADGKLFYKASNGSIASITTSPATDSFATINANSSLILATSPYDTLSIIPGNNITISSDTVNKRITINSTASGGGGSNIDQFARDTANSAINSAAVLTSTIDTFTGNGSNTAFTLSVTPATINYTTAVVGGVTQPKSAYSIIGTTLTFNSAPANNQIVEVTTIGTSNATLYTVNNIISPFLLMGA
jgi:hypothetical protein